MWISISIIIESIINISNDVIIQMPKSWLLDYHTLLWIKMNESLWQRGQHVDVRHYVRQPSRHQKTLIKSIMFGLIVIDRMISSWHYNIILTGCHVINYNISFYTLELFAKLPRYSEEKCGKYWLYNHRNYDCIMDFMSTCNTKLVHFSHMNVLIHCCENAANWTTLFFTSFN